MSKVRKTKTSMAIGKPPYRKGDKRSTDFKVAILDGQPSIQANWGGRMYGVPLSIVGFSDERIIQRFQDIRVAGTATFGSSVRIGVDSTTKSALRVFSDGSLSIGKKGASPNFAVAADGTVSITADIGISPVDGTIAHGDSLVFIDTDDSDSTKKEALHDVASKFAGTGLSASSSEINVDASQTQITSVGTIGTGTWQGTPIAQAYGGTGLDGATNGKIVIADGDGAPVHLDVGSSTAITILGTVATGTWEGDVVDVAHGGTGKSTLFSNAILTGNGTGQIISENNHQYIGHVTGGNLNFGNKTTINTAAGDLILAPGVSGDLRFNPTGKEVLPDSNWDISLGAHNLQWKQLYAAELIVQTLVAAEVMSTIGGRILVAPTSELISDIAASGGATTIEVKHSSFSNADIVVLQTYSTGGTAQFEAIKIGSGASSVTGGFEYTGCERGFNSSGVNAWKAGDAVVSTGGVGDGYIDLYSDHSLTVDANYGPTITGMVRSATDAIASVEPMWAIGNLNGWYGEGSTVYGVGLGKYSAEHMVIKSGGIKIFNGNTDVMSEWDGSTLTLGGATGATFDCMVLSPAGAKIYGNTSANHVLINNNSVGIYGSSTNYVSISLDMVKIAADDADYLLIDSDGMDIYEGGELRAIFGQTTVIGSGGGAVATDSTNDCIRIENGSITLYESSDTFVTVSGSHAQMQAGVDDYLKVNNNGMWLYEDGELRAMFGQTTVISNRDGGDVSGSSKNNCIRINSDGVRIYDNKNAFISLDSSGLDVFKNEVLYAHFGLITYVGNQTDDHIKITSAKIEFKQNEVELMSLGYGDINMTGKINITSLGTRNVIMGISNSDLGTDNISLGYNSGPNLNSNSYNNICIGSFSGETSTNGHHNICIGTENDTKYTYTHDSVSIGHENQVDTLGVVVGNYCKAAASVMVIGDRLDKSATSGNTGWIWIGTYSGSIKAHWSESGYTWSAGSDRRIKKNIKREGIGLDFINDLHPSRYKIRPHNERPKEFDSYQEGEPEVPVSNKEHYGLIAQEVKEAIDKHNAGDYFTDMWSEEPDGCQWLGLGEAVMPLIKAVQELSAKVDALEAKGN